MPSRLRCWCARLVPVCLWLFFCEFVFLLKGNENLTNVMMMMVTNVMMMVTKKITTTRTTRTITIIVKKAGFGQPNENAPAEQTTNEHSLPRTLGANVLPLLVGNSEMGG